MPAGSPGMEMGDRKDHYKVILFNDQGQTRVSTNTTDGCACEAGLGRRLQVCAKVCLFFYTIAPLLFYDGV